jgi:membrane fusion protein, macrolide-specific efflux system
MRKNKFKIFLAVLAVAGICVFVAMRSKSQNSNKETNKEISPVIGSIQTFISTTGTVLPQNRLEVKPTVNGRIESILVQEGEKVTKGQTLAWMSSTERAALLDAAQGQSEAILKYWEDVYKPIPVLSPIDGEVIVARTQPGQTITTVDDVVVLSDHLIIRAQVDETDIGKIKLKQSAVITLDAYPDTKIKAAVEHIYYESTTVNNVTIYSVDLLPEDVPPFFRSGMNATIDFKAEGRENVLIIPVEAAHKDKNQSYVLLKVEDMKEPVKRRVTLGITDDKNFEVISGIDINDKIVIKVKKYSLPKNSTGSNPFMPARPSSQQRRPSN